MKDVKKLIYEAVGVSKEFRQYGVFFAHGSKQFNIPVTHFFRRPANMFFDALGIKVTQPGSGLFKITGFDEYQFRKETLDKVVSVRASNHLNATFVIRLGLKSQVTKVDVPEMVAYGDGVFEINCEEIMSIIEDQQVYLCPSLPLEDYIVMKTLLKDKVLIYDGSSVLEGYQIPYPNRHGDTLSLDPYDYGTMVVKKDNFWVFVDDNGRIRNRSPGSKDCLKLISACGIRQFQTTFNGGRGINKICRLMYDTFQTVFEACGEKSILVMSAIGMGVWRGRGDCYWRAFLQALIDAKTVPVAILINPAHQPHKHPRIPVGTKFFSANIEVENGDEFIEYIKLYWRNNPHDNLRRIGLIRKDILSVARELRERIDPNELDICVLNASDPDVTLGNHVGEYVNNVPHVGTTEENFAAIGTSGLCWEWLSNPIGEGRVHNRPSSDSAWAKDIRFDDYLFDDEFVVLDYEAEYRPEEHSAFA